MIDKMPADPIEYINCRLKELREEMALNGVGYYGNRVLAELVSELKRVKSRIVAKGKDLAAASADVETPSDSVKGSP